MNPGRAQSLMTLAGAVGTAWLLGCMNPTDSNQSDESLALSQAAASQGGWGGKSTICHIPPGNPANAHTISVGNAAVAAHLAHGDKAGACPDVVREKKSCSETKGEAKAHGGLAPKIRSGKVAVCHIPPGNPANAHTIVIGVAALDAHLAHGDHVGACAASSEESGPADCGTHGDAGNHGNGGSTHGGDSTSTGGDSDGGSNSGTGTSQPPVDSTSNY